MMGGGEKKKKQLSGAQKRKKKKEKEEAMKEALAEMERLKLGPTSCGRGWCCITRMYLYRMSCRN